MPGKFVYFTTPRGEFTGVREYGPDKNTNTDDAVDVTAHVPAYIPANVFKMVAATNENLLLLMTSDEPEAMFVYKFYSPYPFHINERVLESRGDHAVAADVKIKAEGAHSSFRVSFLRFFVVKLGEPRGGVSNRPLSRLPAMPSCRGPRHTVRSWWQHHGREAVTGFQAPPSRDVARRRSCDGTSETS